MSTRKKSAWSLFAVTMAVWFVSFFVYTMTVPWRPRSEILVDLPANPKPCLVLPTGGVREYSYNFTTPIDPGIQPYPDMPPLREIPKRQEDYVIDVFIRSYSLDAHWLTFCLRGLQKFLGPLFREVIVAVPMEDMTLFREIVRPYKFVRLEQLPKAFLMGYHQQMYDKLHADHYTDADFIMHTDSDTILAAEIEAKSLFQDGRARIICDDWSRSGTGIVWKGMTAKMMGFDPPYDCMRMQNPIYPRLAYSKLREELDRTHGSFREFAKTRQGFSEYVSLGNWCVANNQGVLVRPFDKDVIKLVQKRSYDGLDRSTIVYYECILSGAGVPYCSSKLQ